MITTVRALLIQRDNPSSFWVGEFARGKGEGKLAFPGGKAQGPEYILTALMRELCEETRLPAEAFDVPLRVRPVGIRHSVHDDAYCFLVWLKPGHVPAENEEMTNWRTVTAKEAMIEPRLISVCKAFLMAWLERGDCPFANTSTTQSRTL
ncbi:MAG: NUDIX domain-containing protein [Proteobacteria bacterium]|nr:NUDIX domain-containing protein [Pseudomonadota bacterium]